MTPKLGCSLNAWAVEEVALKAITTTISRLAVAFLKTIVRFRLSKKDIWVASPIRKPDLTLIVKAWLGMLRRQGHLTEVSCL